MASIPKIEVLIETRIKEPANEAAVREHRRLAKWSAGAAWAFVVLALPWHWVFHGLRQSAADQAWNYAAAAFWMALSIRDELRAHRSGDAHRG